MEIKLPLDVGLQAAASKVASNPLNLKLDQLLSAKVIDTQIMLDTLALNIAGKRVQVQAQQPLSLQPGQSLQLQVIKLHPVPEFRIVASASQTSLGQAATVASDAPILRMLSPQPQVPAPASPQGSLKQLPVGQQLTATVIENASGTLTLQLSRPLNPTLAGPTAPPNAATQPGNVVVTLDARQWVFVAPQNEAASSPVKLPASAPPLLEPGTQIALQVLKSGDAPSFAVSLPAAGIEQKIVELFKQLLPIQASTAPLLNHLAQILPALEHDATIAETLKRLAQDILASIPLKTQLAEPARLKQSIDQSGLFLESKLAQLLSGKEGAWLQDDMKFKLLKFVQLLTTEIEAQAQLKSAQENTALLREALQKAHGALANLTLDQFQSLPKDESAKMGWLLELPFFHDSQADHIQIEIEQDKQANQDTHQKNWAVSITITPPELATIHCRISCYDGAVNTRFWSDAADTVETINAHLDYLKQQFEQKGLKTGYMEAHQGKPEATDTARRPLTHLLSEKA